MPFSKIAQKVATSVFTLKVPKVKRAQAVALFLAPFTLFFLPRASKISQIWSHWLRKNKFKKCTLGFFSAEELFLIPLSCYINFSNGVIQHKLF